MSMTREEAIKAFEEIRENAQNNLGAKWAHGCDGYYRDKIELADVALSALRTPTREQVEKVWRGKWELVRRMAASIECKCPKCQRTVIFTGKPANFCEKCGSAMTNEALEMVMERINKMEEITDEH